MRRGVVRDDLVEILSTAELPGITAGPDAHSTAHDLLERPPPHSGSHASKHKGMNFADAHQAIREAERAGFRLLFVGRATVLAVADFDLGLR